MWRFFAPRPGMHDHYVLYRNRISENQHTPWQELYVPGERHWSHITWLPRRRLDKAVLDAAAELRRYGDRTTDIAQFQLTVPYLCLLNMVTNTATHHTDAREVQFAIVLAAGYDETEAPEVVFLSDFHALSPS